MFKKPNHICHNFKGSLRKFEVYKVYNLNVLGFLQAFDKSIKLNQDMLNSLIKYKIVTQVE